MRAEVQVVDVVNSADVLSNLKKTARRIEKTFPVIRIPHCSVDFITQTIAKRQARLDFPVILSVKAHRVLGDMPVGIAKAAVSEVRFAQQQLLYIILH